MIPMMRKVQLVVAEQLGCGDCTMLEPWMTASIQKPSKCKLDEKYIFCPVTGKMPYDWQKFYEKARYMYMDEGGEDGR